MAPDLAPEYFSLCRSCGTVHTENAKVCTESGCGTKLQNKSGQTILRFAKFDLLARIKAYWQTPGIAKDLLYVTTRQRGDGDVFDGDLLRSRDPQDLVNKVLLSLTGDSTVIQTFRNKSYTPLVLRYLNLPPHLRHTHQGLMVWAILPPKVPDTTKILEFLLRDIIDRTGPSMEFVVREYRRDRHSRYADRTLQIEFHRLLEDSRGLHKSIMSKQTPAYIGGQLSVLPGQRSQGQCEEQHVLPMRCDTPSCQ